MEPNTLFSEMIEDVQDTLLSEHEKTCLLNCLQQPYTQADVDNLYEWAISIRVRDLQLALATRGLVNIWPGTPPEFQLSELGCAILNASNADNLLNQLFGDENEDDNEDEGGTPKADNDTQ